MSGQLDDLPRAWIGLDLPGYREAPLEFRTYHVYSFADLPRIDCHLDDHQAWLLTEPADSGSLADSDEGVAERPATAAGLIDLLVGSDIAVPESFAHFIGDREPRRRVRSPTDCFLDLAQSVVEMPSGGGTLIHFLSDSQFVEHWLLHVGRDGAEAVVVSTTPYGYEGHLAIEPSALIEGDLAVCADSFSEFLYRYWIENEIWFRLSRFARETEPELTARQLAYAQHYRR